MEHDAKNNIKFSVGDIVSYTKHSKLFLVSGAEVYTYGIVVSEFPLIVVSQNADMRWERTLKPEKLFKLGKLDLNNNADMSILEKCMSRLEK